MAEEAVLTAPVEAPVADVSAPAVTEQPAVETTPQEFTSPTREQGEDDGAYARRFAEARTAFDKGVKPETAKPADKPAEPVKEPEKVEEQKLEVPEPDIEVGDPLEDTAPIAPKDLTSLLKANPELDKQLDTLGVKGQFYENARLASKAIKFQEVFHDPEEAKFAKGAAENFGMIDNFMTDIPAKGREGVDALLTHMWNMDVVTDADGKPVLDAKGEAIPQGNVSAFLSNLAEITWEQRFPAHLATLEAQAKAAIAVNPDDDKANDILAAVEVLKNAKTGPVPQELSPEQKAKDAELKSREDAIARRDQEGKQAEIQQRETKIIGESESTIHSEIDALLGRTALPKEQFGLIRNEIYEAIVAQLEQDKMFQSKRDWIMKAQWSDSVAKSRVAHNVASMKNVLYGTRNNGIAKQVLEKYGLKLISKQGERKQTIDAQIKASQAEPRGKSGIAAPAGDKSPSEKRALAVENLKKKGIVDGEYGFEGALMKEMMAITV